LKRSLAVLLALAVSLLTACPADAAPVHPAGQDPQQTKTKTPIKHFIVLMQENHSFDNYFGNYPGADGIPASTCMPRDPAKPAAGCVKPYWIGDQPIVDLGHSVDVYKAEFNGGKMDSFIATFAAQPSVGTLAMGHYDDRDVPYYYNVADNYVLFDRMFTSAAGGSVWNHFFWTTGSPGNPKSDSLLSSGFDHVPTIFDRLQAAGITWKFYVQGYDPQVNFRNPGDGDRAAQLVWCPLLNYNRFLDDPALHERIVPLAHYYTDLQNGTLPSVSFLVPAGASEHPPGSIQAGERFVRTLINALMSSTSWNSSAFMWTYDDWGGWYDHVVPPKVDKYGYGFRAPALLVSPYAHKGQVDHTTLDFTSQLKFIENNWGVAPLASRDAKANDITSAFDFNQSPRSPAFLSEQRHPLPPAKPTTSVVYVVYGAALALTVLLVLVGAIRRGSRIAVVAGVVT